jgi:AcrR family transcriptional regulator
MEEIAAEARIAKPIVYRHLGDKAAIYEAVAAWHLERLMAQLQAALASSVDGRARLRATIDTYLAYVERERAAYRFLLEGPGGEWASAPRVQRFVEQVAAAVAGELRDALEAAGQDASAAEPWAYGIVGMVELAGHWWQREQSMTRERLVDALVSLLWNGFTGAA